LRRPEKPAFFKVFSVHSTQSFKGMAKRRVYRSANISNCEKAFSKENVLANQPLLNLITNFANQKGATPAQISLAWMLHKKDFIVPIPGARKPERIQENLNAVDVELTNNEFNQIESELAKIEIHGNRTDEDIAKLRNMM
jgi:aryl-alcohol dehydrogenase-like predicted oxidoreductase